jgi:hypothetical protein
MYGDTAARFTNDIVPKLAVADGKTVTTSKAHRAA